MKGFWTLLMGCMLAFCDISAQEGFSCQALPDAVFIRMQGRSYAEGCTTPREDLRYLTVLHYNKDREEQQGELVCHKDIADDLLDIFRELHKAMYPIERMVLVDEYGADDEASMRDNNTSAFNFRRISGTKALSRHSRGMAIDINPLYNPCIRRRKGKQVVSPDNAAGYTDRSKKHPYKIERGDLCHRLFKAHGFTWGGDWKNSKDYQHFEKK